MASLDEEIRLDEEENRRELAFIRTQLPSDVKKFYSDKDILRREQTGISFHTHPVAIGCQEVL